MDKKPGSGTRHLTERVKTAKGRKTSSTRWLQRQLNDPYVKQAKAEGYRSRAAYKLLELQEKYKLLKPGMRVVDLGAAPGGWSQVAADITKAGQLGTLPVLAIDILPMQPLPGVEAIQLDFMADSASDTIIAKLGGKIDCVLSDMAPNTTGHAATDHIRIIAICEAAFYFACEILAEGGSFICKVRQGGTEQELLKAMKSRFSSVQHAKPAASRKDSAETYAVAKGFKG